MFGLLAIMAQTVSTAMPKPIASPAGARDWFPRLQKSLIALRIPCLDRRFP